jgi:hypothetical protein
MGLMQGKVMGNSIVIMDSFALPVQGTETRVNAANEANEYMVEYVQGSEKVVSISLIIPIVLTLTRVWMTGGEIGERNRMVSFASRVRMLVVWDRR